MTWGSFGPWVTDQVSLVEPEVSKASESPHSGCQTTQTGTPSCPTAVFPLETHSVHSNVCWYQLRTIRLLLGLQGTAAAGAEAGGSQPVSHSQCIHAHRRQFSLFVKYQCICCPGGVPKTSCTIHTKIIHSFLPFFVFVSVSIKKKKKNPLPPIRDFVLLLQQTTFRAFSPKRSRRHWVSVWCKSACFGWNSTLEQSNQHRSVGRRRLFLSLNFPLRCVCLVGARPAFRCASSCEEPDGRTWRNICHSDCI